MTRHQPYTFECTLKQKHYSGAAQPVAPRTWTTAPRRGPRAARRRHARPGRGARARRGCTALAHRAVGPQRGAYGLRDTAVGLPRRGRPRVRVATPPVYVSALMYMTLVTRARSLRYRVTSFPVRVEFCTTRRRRHATPRGERPAGPEAWRTAVRRRAAHGTLMGNILRTRTLPPPPRLRPAYREPWLRPKWRRDRSPWLHSTNPGSADTSASRCIQRAVGHHSVPMHAAADIARASARAKRSCHANGRTLDGAAIESMRGIRRIRVVAAPPAQRGFDGPPRLEWRPEAPPPELVENGSTSAEHLPRGDSKIFSASCNAQRTRELLDRFAR